MMARERERVFGLQKFSIQHDTEMGTAGDQQETQANIFSRIYGANEADYGRDKKNTMLEDSSDAGYVEPARTSYPEDTGILPKFGNKPKPSRNPDDIEMEFN